MTLDIRKFRAEEQQIGAYSGAFVYQEPFKKDSSTASRVINEVVLACVLTMKGFAMDIRSIAKLLVRPLLVLSGGRFDGRVAFRSAREAAFGSSGRPTAGFRRASRRA